jgi:hypothetical protein
MLVRDVINATAQASGLSVAKLLSPDRSRPTARVRQVGMLVASRVTKASLSAIGRRWGGRDHTTVHHATVRALECVQEGDDLVVETLAEILSTIGFAELPPARPDGAPVRCAGRAALMAEIATLETRLALARARLAALDGAA